MRTEIQKRRRLSAGDRHVIVEEDADQRIGGGINSGDSIFRSSILRVEKMEQAAVGPGIAIRRICRGAAVIRNRARDITGDGRTSRHGDKDR